MGEIDIIWGKKEETEKAENNETHERQRPEKSRKPKTNEKDNRSCIRLSVTNETTRSDIKSLLFCYNPKKIQLLKARNNSSEHYATAQLPNIAMALHAIKTFHNSDHREIIGYDRPLQVSLLRSRAQNKKIRYIAMKKR
ncbi:Nucleotide-binding alpha-beta plait [Perkinsela sp. CCAP 1560/4]|nr:Nucleotide-binding alpha-beta plait [Perkinsela sp. CCAP 1560/4]|eukprot:KNH06569.1 Nucleotide-binding alpha-beta plait [Perkinsela sp. CCAP 1560/4]